jgi:arylsulfatase A-like enzyme
MSIARGIAPLALACALAACGAGTPEAAPARGVVHLELALQDGRASADVLAGRREVVARWTLARRKLDDILASWELSPVDAAPGRDQVGVRLRPAAGHETELIELVYQRELPAGGFNVLEVDGVFPGRGEGQVTWGNALPVPGVQPHEKRLVAPLRQTGGPQTLRFSLGEHPGWSGAIQRFKLVPVTRGPQAYQLHEIRFVREGFRPGPAREGPDGGLVAFGGDARRAWPSDDGVPLLARARVPRGGRVAVDTGLMGRLHGAREEVHFALDARVQGGGWRELARRDFVPAEKPGSGRWRPLTADLAELEGREVELRFRAWRADGDGTGGVLEEARFLWGAPLLLGAPPADRRPNVLLVTLDTVRADALGVYGGPPDTPALDALAAGGLWFSDAWSACNSTLPSHVSILTGLDVPSHGALDNRSVLAGGVRTLAEALRAEGYHTAAATSVQHLGAGYAGLGRGFDQYLDMLPRASVDGGLTVAHARDWLASWRGAGERPWFLWVHLFDAHTPYGPPHEFFAEYARRAEARGAAPPPKSADPPTIGPTLYTGDGQFLAGVSNLDYARFTYAAGVAYTDTLVGRLLEDLDAGGEDAWTVVAVTADHGESLGEHGIYFNHSQLYPQSVHVPLLLRVPGGPTGRVDARASGVDLAPTLAGLVGLAGFRADGVDLLELAAGGERAGGRRVHFVHSGLLQVGCRDDAVHFVRSERDVAHMEGGPGLTAGARELFRTRDDPGCARDLAGVEPALADEYAAALQAWLDAASTGEHVAAETTSADERALDGLGYGGGDDDAGDER